MTVWFKLPYIILHFTYEILLQQFTKSKIVSLVINMWNEVIIQFFMYCAFIFSYCVIVSWSQVSCVQDHACSGQFESGCRLNFLGSYKIQACWIFCSSSVGLPVMNYLCSGSWSLQFERGSGLVTLRSLLWQGYIFYHVPGTCAYGSIYVGNGEKNMDLPFML